ncbi:MAG TPA: hypothetical protein VD813_16320, partial [Pseudonocardia sp.]|nr:hypothetical protein [Pseudonocardia sp.]
AGRVAALGAPRVLSALVGADVPGATRDPEADALLAEVRAAAGSGGPAHEAAAHAEADERLRAMHRASRYTETPPLGIPAGIELWPVRLLAPAPAGKLFARGLPPGSPPRLVFGDMGQVNRDATLDWPQWYRLGIWHATLAGRWGAAVAGAAAPELDAAFAGLPGAALRKVTAHEATVSTFRSWPSYFLDGLVAAAKVVLEEGVTGPAGGDDQMRWLRSLGRVHLQWFVDAVRDAGVEKLDPARLARAWLADAPGLAELRPVFRGPLAACENPLWAVRPRVLFSPGVDRITRRSLTAWLRTQWPGGVETDPDPDLAAPVAPGGRLVFATAADTAWLDALGADVAPGERADWARRCGAIPEPGAGGGLLYAYRHPAPVPGPDGGTWTGDVWSRVCIAPTGAAVSRLQQLRRPFADWTALGPDGSHGSVSSGRLDRDEDGLLRFVRDRPH